jgi:hypothetical protein
MMRILYQDIGFKDRPNNENTCFICLALLFVGGLRCMAIENNDRILGD